MIKQIYFLTLFAFSVYSYAYVLVTPSILLKLSPLTVKYIQILSQSFFKFMLINGFKCSFYQAKTEQKIKELFKESKDKIDIIIANHISNIDYFIIFTILKQYKIYNFSGIIGPTVKYYPGTGIIMNLGNSIEINRNWQLDKNIIEPQLDDIKLDNKSKHVIFIQFKPNTLIFSHISVLLYFKLALTDLSFFGVAFIIPISYLYCLSIFFNK